LKYLKKRRKIFGKHHEFHEEDPLSGVANLFDVAIVMVVGLLFSLVSAYQMVDLLSPTSELTIVKKSDDGKLTIIRKDKKEIRAQRTTQNEVEGEGIRLGTAYQLKDGRVVYVPSE